MDCGEFRQIYHFTLGHGRESLLLCSKGIHRLWVEEKRKRAMGDNKAINIKIKQQIMPFLCRINVFVFNCLPACPSRMWSSGWPEEWGLTKSILLVSFLDFHLHQQHHRTLNLCMGIWVSLYFSCLYSSPLVVDGGPGWLVVRPTRRFITPGNGASHRDT